MKKLYSLVRASMSSGMNLFKFKSKNNKKKPFLFPFFVAFYLMFMVWGLANSLFEQLSPLGLEYLVLAMMVLGISLMTIMEGIYKVGPLIFNAKDDQILLSLPIKRRTVLFVKIFKFYVFELLFNSLFLLPSMVAYIRWESISWTYYLTSFFMLIILPVIPIVISSFIGVLTISFASRFKYKNALQVVMSMTLIIVMMVLSFNSNSIMGYLMEHASSITDLITRLYYPAGVYVKLVTDFNWFDLIGFVIVNIGLFIMSIVLLSKVYFRTNSQVKAVVTSSNSKRKVVIKQNSKIKSLIKKELNTFFKTPVFIVNSGFSLVLFLLAVIIVWTRYESVLPILTNSEEGLGIASSLISSNISIIILILIVATSFTTSITNSVISLEGKNINILKSLPVKPKTILMAKIYACLVITTPVIILGDILLFIKFKLKIVEIILLLIISIVIPLVSHFIGILANLKYPKLDYENSAEVVKQSFSSFISVMIGMILMIVTIGVIINVIGSIDATLLLFIVVLIYGLVDIILYVILISKGVKEYNKLSV